MVGRSGVAGLLAITTACRIGQSVDDYPPATDPHGVMAELRLVTGTHLAGELVAVSDTAFLLISRRRLTLVRYKTIGRARFLRMPSVSYEGTGGPLPAHFAALRARARYPHGVSPDLLERLLRAYGQDSLELAQP